MLHRVILISAALFCFGGAFYNSCVKRTKGFSIKKVISHHPSELKWQTPPPDSEFAISAISQPYRYLGSGKQTYAFESLDGKYVLKLFKQKHMKPIWWKSRLTNMRHRSLREKTFSSYLLAFTHLQEETGLIYLHLTKTNFLRTILHLRDNKGEPFTLDLDTTEFLIQKKASHIFPSLASRIDSGDIEGAKEIIDSIIHLIAARSNAGIKDVDMNCERNIGLIGNRAIEIDIGEFSYRTARENEDVKKELLEGTQDLHEWLKSRNPHLGDYLLSHIQDSVEGKKSILWESETKPDQEEDL